MTASLIQIIDIAKPKLYKWGSWKLWSESSNWLGHGIGLIFGWNSANLDLTQTWQLVYLQPLLPAQQPEQSTPARGRLIAPPANTNHIQHRDQKAADPNQQKQTKPDRTHNTVNSSRTTQPYTPRNQTNPGRKNKAKQTNQKVENQHKLQTIQSKSSES